MPLAKEEVFKRLEDVRDLPTLPVVIQKLGEAIRDPNADAERIAGIIEDDPAMMAKVLKVVNSVLYGAREPIHSLQLAVARMGLNAINNIAMSTSVFSVFPRSEQTDFSREEFWRHCICTGIACGVVHDRSTDSIEHHYTRDVLHLAGLLHDIGKILFENYFHDEFMQAIEACAERRVPLFQVELEFLGVDHAQVGAWLGERWNLSSLLIDAVRWHHEPENANDAARDLVMLCHTANYICNLEKIGNSGDVVAPAFFKSVWKKLGLEVSDITSVVDSVKEEAKHSEVLLSFLS